MRLQTAFVTFFAVLSSLAPVTAFAEGIATDKTRELCATLEAIFGRTELSRERPLILHMVPFQTGPATDAIGPYLTRTMPGVSAAWETYECDPEHATVRIVQDNHQFASIIRDGVTTLREPTSTFTTMVYRVDAEGVIQADIRVVDRITGVARDSVQSVELDRAALSVRHIANKDDRLTGLKSCVRDNTSDARVSCKIDWNLTLSREPGGRIKQVRNHVAVFYDESWNLVPGSGWSLLNQLLTSSVWADVTSGYDALFATPVESEATGVVADKTRELCATFGAIFGRDISSTLPLIQYWVPGHGVDSSDAEGPYLIRALPGGNTSFESLRCDPAAGTVEVKSRSSSQRIQIRAGQPVHYYPPEAKLSTVVYTVDANGAVTSLETISNLVNGEAREFANEVVFDRGAPSVRRSYRMDDRPAGTKTCGSGIPGERVACLITSDTTLSRDSEGRVVLYTDSVARFYDASWNLIPDSGWSTLNYFGGSTVYQDALDGFNGT